MSHNNSNGANRHEKHRLSNHHSRPHLDEEDGCGERPHKKQSNIHTIARINLYTRIKVSGAKFVNYQNAEMLYFVYREC